MSLLELLSDEKTWKRFYDYKTSLICRSPFEKVLAEFISQKRYLTVCQSISNGNPFPLPAKAVINKTNAAKKRIVYSYPTDENIVLKLLTYLLLRKYDSLFADNLYSFRPRHSAKDAVRKLTSMPDIHNLFFYKADISNYFNSIPMERFLPLLHETLYDDPQLSDFLCGLLSEPLVLDKGNAVAEQKGIMAGVPLASFYANLYLAELDHLFASLHVPYARYSDDIIVFAESEEKIQLYADTVRSFLTDHGLSINPQKETMGMPHTPKCFLGFTFSDGLIDIAPVTVKKIKAKMRRKTRALKRWQQRNHLDGTKAASAFIRIFNRKLLEAPDDNELSWSYWFFSVINTSRSLKDIDHYAQNCIRFLVSSSHTKSRFNVRYDDIKQLGYRSLVHAYYLYEQQTTEQPLST